MKPRLFSKEVPWNLTSWACQSKATPTRTRARLRALSNLSCSRARWHTFTHILSHTFSVTHTRMRGRNGSSEVRAVAVGDWFVAVCPRVKSLLLYRGWSSERLSEVSEFWVLETLNCETMGTVQVWRPKSKLERLFVCWRWNVAKERFG